MEWNGIDSTRLGLHFIELRSDLHLGALSSLVWPAVPVMGECAKTVEEHRWPGGNGNWHTDQSQLSTAGQANFEGHQPRPRTQHSFDGPILFTWAFHKILS